MIAGVADTHAALWLLFGDARLSVTAKSFFEKAAAERHRIALTPISLAEVLYLMEKDRLPSSAFDDLKAALADPVHVLDEIYLTVEIVDAMRRIPRSAVPDMPDRIVAATALYLGVPLITRDGSLRGANVPTIW